MRHTGVRTAVVCAGAGALWLFAGGGAGAQDGVELNVRLPLVPAETLPAMRAPDSGALEVTVDPGDDEHVDPAPRVIVRLKST